MSSQMIITFLGTAAANAFPEAFCKCRNCAQARRLGGPSLRKRSAALINNDLLIDLGPDIMAASHMHGCPLDDVRYCCKRIRTPTIWICRICSLAAPPMAWLGRLSQTFAHPAKPWNEPQRHLREILRITVSYLLRLRDVSTSRSTRSAHWNPSWRARIR